MTVDTARAEHVAGVARKGKRLIGSVFGRNAFKQINEFPRRTPLVSDARLPRLRPSSRAVPPSPFVSRAPSTTCVPAELRLNWVNAGRVAVGDGGQSYWLLDPVTQTATSGAVFGSWG